MSRLNTERLENRTKWITTRITTDNRNNDSLTPTSSFTIYLSKKCQAYHLIKSVKELNEQLTGD